MKHFRQCTGIVAIVAMTLAATMFAAEGGARGRDRSARRQGGFGAMSRGFFGGGGMNMVRLLNSDQVRKEIKATEEQIKKIGEILTAHRKESQGLSSGLRGRDMTREERQKARDEMMKKRQALIKKTEGTLAAALKKEQVKRLNEIVLQQQGVNGLTSKYVVDGLKLSKEQVAKIKAAFKARDDETQKLMASMRGRFGRRGGGDDQGQGQGQGPSREEIREKMQALRKKAETTAMGVLSKDQKAQLEKLKGQKFELDRRSLYRRGTRGEGGQGRPQRRQRPTGGAI